MKYSIQYFSSSLFSNCLNFLDSSLFPFRFRISLLIISSCRSPTLVKEIMILLEFPLI